MSSPSTSSIVPLPPPNNSLNTLLKRFFISANCISNCFLISVSSSSITPTSTSAASVRSACCPVRSSYLSISSLYCSTALTLTSPSNFIVPLSSSMRFFISPGLNVLAVFKALALWYVSSYCSHI